MVDAFPTVKEGDRAGGKIQGRFFVVKEKLFKWCEVCQNQIGVCSKCSKPLEGDDAFCVREVRSQPYSHLCRTCVKELDEA